MNHQSAFKSPDDKAAYLAAYDEAMESWPVPYEEAEVQSRFGTTYLVMSGPKTGPPLVLLHGFMTTVFLWSPNITDLSQNHRVYAIDIMGHRNRSLPHEPIRDLGDYIEWFTAILDELSLTRVDLMGQSFGGWLALNFAIKQPQRVRKLVLLSPAASLLPLVKQFTLRAILSAFYPRHYWFNTWMRWMGLDAHQGSTEVRLMLNLIWLGGKHLRTPPDTMRVMPGVLSDEALQSLQVPVLLLLGEKEVIYDSTKAMARVRQLIPDLTGEIIPESSHDMSMNQYQIVDARILDFLATD